MDVQEILSQLSSGERWETIDLGLDLVGLPLRLSSWGEDSPPGQVEMELLRTIFENTETWLASGNAVLDDQIEIQSIRGSDDVNFDDPNIWIDRDRLQAEGPTLWSIVIGVDVNENFGMHLEFDGLDAVEMWAGD